MLRTAYFERHKVCAALLLKIQVSTCSWPGQPGEAAERRPLGRGGGLAAVRSWPGWPCHASGLSRRAEQPPPPSSQFVEFHAYSEALRLLGEDPFRRAAYGEALVAAAGGVVTDKAREAFAKALAAARPAAGALLSGARRRAGRQNRRRHSRL